MRNKDILYKVSKDYKKLFKLLKEKKTIIGFICIGDEDIANGKYSDIEEFCYNEEYKMFEFGFLISESDLNKIGIVKFCKKHNIRFIEPNC